MIQIWLVQGLLRKSKCKGMVPEPRTRRCILHLKKRALSCKACSAQPPHIFTFHVDHYGGLSETWDNGVIYCSEQTARLIQHMDQLRIRKELIKALPMDVAVTVEGMLHLDAPGRPVSTVLRTRAGCTSHFSAAADLMQQMQFT